MTLSSIVSKLKALFVQPTQDQTMNTAVVSLVLFILQEAIKV